MAKSKKISKLKIAKNKADKIEHSYEVLEDYCISKSDSIRSKLEKLKDYVDKNLSEKEKVKFYDEYKYQLERTDNMLPDREYWRALP